MCLLVIYAVPTVCYGILSGVVDFSLWLYHVGGPRYKKTTKAASNQANLVLKDQKYFQGVLVKFQFTTLLLSKTKGETITSCSFETYFKMPSPPLLFTTGFSSL